MRRLLTRALCVACLLVLTCAGALVAHAAPAGSGDESQGSGVGALSDRYESLNILGNSLTEEEGVVIETRIGVLTSVNRALDDSEVRFSGEVVGNVLNANPGYRWANVMGSTQATISVYMPDDLAEYVKNTGSYHAIGTTMKITGVYHVACPEHQGELDVHATNAEVMDTGGPITHLIDRQRMLTAFSLCLIALLVLAAYLGLKAYLSRRGDE